MVRELSRTLYVTSWMMCYELGHASRNFQQLFTSEKPVVKLQFARFEG